MDHLLRPYSEGDEEKIVDFLTIAFKGWPPFDLDYSSLEHWKWKYQNRETIAVAVADDEIIGTFHSIPIKIKMGDSVINSCQGVDVAIHPNYRGKGLSSLLREKSYELRIKNGIKMHYGISGHPVLIAKRKKDEANDNRMFPAFPHKLIELVKIRDIKKHLSTTSKENNIQKRIGYEILKFYHGLNRIIGIDKFVENKNLQINKVNKLNDKYDLFWDKIKNYYKFILIKDSEYLNWRYADKRGGNFIIFQALNNESEICGLIIISINQLIENYPRGNIVDFLFYPEMPEVGLGLLSEAIKYFDERNVNIISAFVFEGHPHAKLLKNAGFIPNTVSPYMTITIFDDISGPLSQLFDSRVEEALFTKGDLDWV